MPNAIFSALKGLAHVGDAALVSAAGGLVGGVRGAMKYDSDQERDPLLAQTPVIGRFKAAAEGAIKGAAIGAAGAAGAKAIQFGARAMLAPEARNLASTETLTGAFIRGFKGMNAPGDIPIGETAARGKRTAAEGGYFSFNTVHGKTLDEAEEVIKQGERTVSPAKVTSKAGTRQVYEVPSGPGRSEALHSKPIPAKKVSPGKKNLGEAAPRGWQKKERVGSPAGRPASATTRAMNQEAAASYRGNAATIEHQRNLYQMSEDIGLDLNLGKATNARGMNYAGVQQFRKLSKEQQGLVGATELPGIVASAVGGLAGTVTHAARAGVGAYKKHIIDPAKEGKAVSAGLFHIKNPNYPSTIPGVKEKIGRDVTAPFVAGVGLLGAATFGIGGAIGATAYGAPAGHPMNAIFKAGDAAVSARAQMEADSAQKIKMQRPTMLGLNDTDEAYFTNPALRPKREARHTPGKYNDDGSLVFALSNLRRAV